MAKLQEIVNRRSLLVEEQAARKKAYDTASAATTSELKTLAEAEALIMGGLDHDMIERGRAVLAICGKATTVRHGFYSDQQRHGVRAGVIEEAKADLANGGDMIARRYFGVKNYDAFGDQRCDCEYGMGPRHGSIVFSVGLTRPLRDRIRTGPHLEDGEIEAALYLLNSLPKIEQLQTERLAA